MNMALRIEDIRSTPECDVEALPSLSGFRRTQDWVAPEAPAAKLRRSLGACGVIAAHIGVVALILWGGTEVYTMVAPTKPITVDVVAENPPKEQTVTPPEVKPDLFVPDVPVVMAPEILIDQPAPTAITVLKVKTPPTPPPPRQSSASQETYLSKIIAHLDRFKTYPASAKRFNLQGVTIVRFQMDRAGRVLGYRIVKSSGRPVLDQEVQALMVRAQPLPPIPQDWPQQQLDLEVPVSFTLN